MGWRVVVAGLGLVVSAAQAGEFPARVSKYDAAVVVDTGSAHGRPGDVVRCGRGQRVGVWVESRQPVVMRDLTVEGCEVGVVVGRVPAAADGEAAPVERAPGGHTVEGLVVSQSVVCLWLLGNGGSASSNWVGDCRYGIVVAGDNILVDANQVLNTSQDGILVTGDGNTIVANRVHASGAHGIDVIGSVPNVAPGVYVPALRDRANSNVIRDNVVTNSGGWDLRQWPVSCPNRDNTFLWNTARKRSARCLR